MPESDSRGRSRIKKIAREISAGKISIRSQNRWQADLASTIALKVHVLASEVKL
jgi:hypothetical protein